MKWVSIDPAAKTGIAVWHGSMLACVGTLRAATKKEAKGIPSAQPTTWLDTVWAAPLLAWQDALSGVRAVVIEESMGFSPKTISQLGERRGYVRALCEVDGVSYLQVNTSAWRRVAAEAWGVSWPQDSKACKALAKALVAEHYGATCTDDEADAVLIGHYAIRTRSVAV